MTDHAPSENDALLLIGHGSSRYPDAGRTLHIQAGRLRERGLFRQVEVALLANEPKASAVLSRMDARTVKVVPFFMDDGYFARVAVPNALAGDPRCRLCPPVGEHGGMAEIIALLAFRGCAGDGMDPGMTSVILIGHGSATSPGRHLALHRHAAKVSSAQIFLRCVPACLEETPFLADVLAAERLHPVSAIGFFAGEGMHVRDDVPMTIAAEARVRGVDGPPVRYHGSVADDARITDIILDQAGMGRT